MWRLNTKNGVGLEFFLALVKGSTSQEQFGFPGAIPGSSTRNKLNSSPAALAGAAHSFRTSGSCQEEEKKGKEEQINTEYRERLCSFPVPTPGKGQQKEILDWING